MGYRHSHATADHGSTGLIRVLLIVLAVGVLGGIVFLAVSDTPPSPQTVTRMVPNDRFQN
jgi:hypothetical protein